MNNYFLFALYHITTRTDREIGPKFDQFVKFSDSDKRGDALSVLSKWASDTIQKYDGAVSFSQVISFMHFHIVANML